jgi:KaiC/GvpD/RAD55 family RecA-like ATPase
MGKEVERVSSGIPGLDELIEGGFVRNSVNLVAGMAGTCKTTFGCQFIWEGLKKGEKGLYVTLEQSEKDIRRDMLRYGWNFSPYIEEGRCKFVEITPGDVDELKASIINEVGRLGKVDRFVLDSLSLAAMGWKERPEEVFKLRTKVFSLLKTLKNLNLTSIVIAEIPSGEQSLGRLGFEEFIVDSVILLKVLPVDIPMRTLQIIKMRGTKHDMRVHPFEVTPEGIVIQKTKKGAYF